MPEFPLGGLVKMLFGIMNPIYASADSSSESVGDCK